MSLVLDRPANPITQSGSNLDGSQEMPEKGFVITIAPGDRYAFVSAYTPPGPEALTLNLLCYFTTEQDAQEWLTLHGWKSRSDFIVKIRAVTFDDALTVARGKPYADGVGLQKGLSTLSYRCVR